jgi:hypothetical protein
MMMSVFGRGINFWKGSIEMSAWFGSMSTKEYGQSLWTQRCRRENKKELVKVLSLLLASVFRLPRMEMFRHVCSCQDRGEQSTGPRKKIPLGL